jgi:peroxiredoxin family protein
VSAAARLPRDRVDALEARFEELETQLRALERRVPSDRVTLVVHSNDFDRLVAAFVIATGAAAMGSEVSMFFAFWGLTAMKKKTRFRKKPIAQALLGAMLPAGAGGTSQKNMLGLGPAFFRAIMKKKHVHSLEELMTTARESGVKMVACGMSMSVMGIEPDELVDGVAIGGVAACLADACDSRATLFV